MRLSIIRSILTLVFLALLFSIDIWSFFWFQTPTTHFLFSFLIVSCWYRFYLPICIIGILLLGSHAVIIDQTIITPLCAQIAILMLLIICRQRLYLSGAIPPLAFILYLGLIALVRPYTTAILFANLSAIGIFSLKLKTSKTRQSLAPIA